MKFKVGDRVEIIEHEDEYGEVGLQGEIVGFWGSASYAVKMDKLDFCGHSCDGNVLGKRGYFIKEHKLKLINQKGETNMILNPIVEKVYAKNTLEEVQLIEKHIVPNLQAVINELVMVANKDAILKIAQEMEAAEIGSAKSEEK